MLDASTANAKIRKLRFNNTAYRILSTSSIGRMLRDFDIAATLPMLLHYLPLATHAQHLISL
jgi:hypothetical protein